MINEELKTFISKMRAAGKTDPEIAAELKTAGWAEADITLAFNPQPVLSADDQSPKVSQSSPPQQSKPQKLNITGALGWGFIGIVMGIIPAILIAVSMGGSSVIFWLVIVLSTAILALIGAKRPPKQQAWGNQSREKLWFETTWAGLLLPLLLSGFGVGVLVFFFIKNKRPMPFVLKLWLLIQTVLFGALLFAVLSTLIQKTL